MAVVNLPRASEAVARQKMAKVTREEVEGKINRKFGKYNGEEQAAGAASALDCAAILRAAEPPLGSAASWKRFCLLCERKIGTKATSVKLHQGASERNDDRGSARKGEGAREVRENRLNRGTSRFAVMEILRKKKGIIIL